MAGDIGVLRAIDRNPEWILQEAARRSLLRFATYEQADFKQTPFHRNYYRILDKFAKGEIKNLIIQAPPQTGKSQGSSRFLPAYMLGLNPDLKVILCSYAATIATDFNRDVQRLIDNEAYRGVFPETKLNGSNVVTVATNYLRNSSVFEIVGHTGSLRVVGRGGSLTSKTADVMIFDDLYKDASEANSPIVRDGAWDWYTKVARTRLHNDSQQLIVFTRWHPQDIIGKIIESEQVIEARKWSDLEGVPRGAWVLVNFEAIKTGEPTEIDPREPGEALWSERHSLERLLALRAIDPVGFECLHQGHPGSAEGRLYQPFKTYIEKSDWGTYVRSGCYVDVADEGDDWTAAIAYDVYKSPNEAWNEQTKRFEPILFALVTGIEFTDANTDVTSVTVPRLINETGTQKAWIESNNGGAQFEKVVRRKVKAMTVPFYQGGNKESRVVTNAPFVNQSIVFPFGWETRWPKAYEHLTGFLRNFSANKHDDMCFVAGTMIATKYGDIPIERIKCGDMIITPLGYCRVIASSCTGEKEVITKFGLTGTPNHPIFQGKMFDRFCGCSEKLLNLHNFKNLQLWTYRKALHSMALNTALWGRDDIIYLNQIPIEGGKIRKDFIRRFGNFIAERKYRKGIVFIIKTAMSLITSFLIWSVYRLGNTLRCIRKKDIWIQTTEKSNSDICVMRKKKRLNGIEVKKDGNGISNTQETSIGLRNSNVSAFNVGRLLRRAIIILCFVRHLAGKGIEHQTLNTSVSASNAGGNLDMGRRSHQHQRVNFVQEVAPQHIQTSDGRRRVYNITVGNAHCYYANGILVSNCDALTGVYEKEIAGGDAKPYGAAVRGVRVH